MMTRQTDDDLQVFGVRDSKVIGDSWGQRMTERLLAPLTRHTPFSLLMAGVLFVLGLLLPLWPITLPVCWFLALMLVIHAFAGKGATQ